MMDKTQIHLITYAETTGNTRRDNISFPQKNKNMHLQIQSSQGIPKQQLKRNSFRRVSIMLDANNGIKLKFSQRKDKITTCLR